MKQKGTTYGKQQTDINGWLENDRWITGGWKTTDGRVDTTVEI